MHTAVLEALDLPALALDPQNGPVNRPPCRQPSPVPRRMTLCAVRACHRKGWDAEAFVRRLETWLQRERRIVEIESAQPLLRALFVRLDERERVAEVLAGTSPTPTRDSEKPASSKAETPAASPADHRADKKLQ